MKILRHKVRKSIYTRYNTRFKGHRSDGLAIRQCKLMRDALDTTHEIIKLIKKSPCRKAIFKRLKEEMARGPCRCQRFYCW